MVRKIIAIFLVSIIGIINARINCIDSACSACSVGFIHGGDICVDRCPIPSLPDSNPCPHYRVYLFDMEFFTQSRYSSHSYNGFNTSGNIPFNSKSKLAPIPTLNQGFYFTPTSSISNITDKVISPDFSFRVSGMFKADGTIFELLCDGISNLKLSVIGNLIQIDIKLMNINYRTKHKEN